MKKIEQLAEIGHENKIAIKKAHAAASKSGCVEWGGVKAHKGYGICVHQGKRWRMHRLAWHTLRGPIPEGMFVCHKCDNPACYNVNHLFLGTPKDNTQDMLAKGRFRVGTSPLGERHHKAKLKAKWVRLIRATHGCTKFFADLYGVDTSTIRTARNGRCWLRDACLEENVLTAAMQHLQKGANP